MRSIFRNIRHAAIVRLLSLPKDVHILDTSCQDGGFLLALANANKEKRIALYGTDISQSDISRAKSLLPNGIFQVADSASLPFPDATFDVVISSLTLHHMADPLGSLLEMKRVMKKTGVIYLIDIMAEGTTLDFILKRTTCPEPYHFEKFYSLAEARDMLAKAGLTISLKKKLWVFPTFSLVSPVIVLGLSMKQ